MEYDIAVNIGNMTATVLPALANASIFDGFFLLLPASSSNSKGVGEIYDGDVALHEATAPPSLEAEIIGTSRGAIGISTTRSGNRLPRDFGAEEVYNMLITTLFLLFVLTTVALLIFLLMRRPPCCPCCQDPYDTSASTNGDSSSQTAHIPYLTETHGIVVKKWMKDSPPPYESPPDYSSLSPELIMDAKTLQELANASQSQSLPVGVHTSGTITTSSSNSQGRSSSPLCTTPLFSTSFCDTPRSLTPTVMSESKVRGVYDTPPSPIFSTHHYPSATNTYVSSSTSTASATVPSAVFGQPGGTLPPAYETLRIYSHEGSRRKDNQ